MKRLACSSLFLLLLMTLTAVTTHKFYVAIHQINYDREKKMIQITSRIFIDDLNAALSAKYKQQTFIGDKNESAQDVVRMQNYLCENFSIKLNGTVRPIHFLSHEIENNVVICYFNIKDATKIKTMEIRNTALFESFPDQQHIINSTVFGEKQSALLTIEQKSSVLKLD